MMVRVKFAKYGPLRFTGHLDVLRFFQKAIRRAGLDVVYTHGFNPHQVMSFATGCRTVQRGRIYGRGNRFV